MSTPTGRRALLLGATGAVGGHVLAELLRSPTFVAVTTIGRRPASLPTPPAKLTQHTVNLEERRVSATHCVARLRGHVVSRAGKMFDVKRALSPFPHGAIVA